jgi:hypothetical protein
VDSRQTGSQQASIFQAVTEDDAGALLDARTRCVTIVLEGFYAERHHARIGGDNDHGAFQGDDVIYNNPHVTVGDWLVEAVSSGAMALTRHEKLTERPGPLQNRIETAHFTTITALSMIGALEALVAQTGDPELADRQWVIRSAAHEAVESWQEMCEERNGLEYAIGSWLTIALHAYLKAFEKNVEVDPMEIAKHLIRALGWTAGELAVGEERTLAGGE